MSSLLIGTFFYDYLMQCIHCIFVSAGRSRRRLGPIFSHKRNGKIDSRVSCNKAWLLYQFCVHCLCTAFAHVRRRERSRAVTAVFGGLDVGSAVGLVLCGPLIKHVGWPSVFYLFAGLGLLWTLIFPRLSPDEPDELVPSELQPDSPGMRCTPTQAHTVCCLNA